MSLQWFKSLFKDELWVFIHPQSITFLRLTRPLKKGLKQHIMHKQVIALPQDLATKHLAAKQMGDNDWQILANYLKPMLKSAKWQGAVPTVIVSNQFARYAVIPWSNELAVEDERQAYMQHCFNLAYGDATKAWDLRMSEPDFGQSAMASAINRGLLQVLHEVFAEADMKLAAVYPQLMLAINQTVSQIKKNHLIQSENKAVTFWLVAIQSERVCLTLFDDSGWRLVKNVGIETDVSEQLTALIQREIVNCNVKEDVPVLLYRPESQRNKSLKLANHQVIPVPSHQFDMQNDQALNSVPSWVLA
ncbi:MAG: hypothetical protein PSV17_05830 [Methylotenera sp.]|uniref:hypothetical protein n=1 Tax=Methylotenera sp. TaxID=2051956 RepID=UPI00248A12BD|nr:hypothetical protein [Methylotenera sp.]MDI1308937.1 hypothetical protein [Methylotenera sp.]